MSLASADVTATFLSCLFHAEELPADGSPPEGAIIAKGIVASVGFHPQRLEEKREVVSGFLSELPKEFSRGKGDGGWSFLYLCQDREGNPWTGDHAVAEQLLLLGLGLGLAGYCVPRDLWPVFPGGMPYVWVKTGDLPDA